MHWGGNKRYLFQPSVLSQFSHYLPKKPSLPIPETHTDLFRFSNKELGETTSPSFNNFLSSVGVALGQRVLLGKTVIWTESWAWHSLFKKPLVKFAILKIKLISQNWVPVKSHPKGAFPLRLNFMKLTWSLNIMILLKDHGKKTNKTWDMNT